MKRSTPRTHRRGPRKWRECFTVWIDFIGDRSQVGPLLDFIAGCPNDGGGQFLSLPLSDQSWKFRDRAGAESCFENLKPACTKRWSPYIRLRLLHDDKPDRCEKPFVQIGPVKHYPLSEGGGHDIAVRRGRGPIVLRKYQRGKCPQMPVRKLRKKGARPNVKK